MRTRNIGSFELEKPLGAWRSQRTPTVTKGARATAYTTGIFQAEEMWQAAERVGPVSSPILRYYALMQATLSVIAASDLPNNEWQPKASHGLTLEYSGEKLDFRGVTLRQSGYGTFQHLCRAIGSPCIEGEVSLIELINSLPLYWQTESDVEGSVKPLLVLRSNLGPEGTNYLSIQDIPSRFKRDSAVDCFEALRFTYPAIDSIFSPPFNLIQGPRFISDSQVLEVWTDSPVARPSLIWDGMLEGEIDPKLAVPGTFTPYLIMPRLRGAERALHPLATWYALLYSFSMLARYHAAAWRGRMDMDKNEDAWALIDLIEKKSSNALGLIGFTLDSFLLRSK